MGWESSRIGLCVGWLLKSHCAANDLGWVAGADAGYQCFPDDPGKVRKPDVSFIQLDRLAAGEQPTGHCRIAPDLAVEVVSPNDLYHEVETKVDEYHAAGTALVWVVNPVQRTVRVDRADGTTTLLRESDTLTGENVLPGFACPVSEIFRQPGQRA